MTLSLDDVRRVRFRMAKRSGQGYEVQDVDSFVDQVEESFQKMTNDAELMQRQVEALQNSAPQSVFAPTDDGELNRLREELEQARRDAEAAQGEVGRLQEAAHNAVAGDQRAEQLTSEVQRLNGENERLRRDLEGAQAAAQSAQRAISDGPIENLVVTTSADASPAVVRLVQLATEQAEQVVGEATAEAKRKVADAEQRAFEITTDARTKADRVESEARVNAEKMTTDARNEADRVTGEAANRAGQIDREAADKRRELFSALETERDDLREKVDSLRGFESTYRENLSNHLQAQLDAVLHARPQPDNVPHLAQPQGSTPRLDALMGDQH